MPAIPYSYRTYAGAAANNSFTLDIPFIQRSHIIVYTNLDFAAGTFESVLQEGTQYQWVSDSVVRILVSTVGKIVSFVRNTPTTALIVEWQDGSNVDMDDFLLSDRQNFYAVQELADRTGTAIAIALAAAGSVASAVPYVPVANVAAIPACTNGNSRIEVVDSTGIQNSSLIAGIPAGFVGSAGIRVRLRCNGATGKWDWVDYAVADPDGRYAKTGDLGGINSTASVNINFTAPSVENNAVADFTVTAGKVTQLSMITLSHQCWIRLFRSAAQRALDTRVAPGGTLQGMIDLGDGKPYAEFVTTATPQSITCNPPAGLLGDQNGLLYMRLVNQSGGTRAITGTISINRLEA